MKKEHRILRFLYFHGEEAISAVFLGFILVILTVQVILRFCFNHSTSWIEELSRYMFIWIIYLASSIAVLQNKHIRIDVALHIWPRAVRKYVELFGDLLWLIFSIALTYFSVRYFFTVQASNSLSPNMQMNMTIPIAILPLGNFLISLRLLIRFVEKAVLHRSIFEDGVSIADPAEGKEGDA